MTVTPENPYRRIVETVLGASPGLYGGLVASVRNARRRAGAMLGRKRSAARLGEANRLLLMAEGMSGVGHWRADAIGGAAYWSDTVCAIHGRPSGYAPPLQTAIDAYHPEDRARVERTIAEALATGRDYELRARIVRPDGKIRRVLSHGRAELGADGSVTGLFGVFEDVTAAYDAAQAVLIASERVAESNRMLAMAEAVAHLGHWRVDKTSDSYFWSDEVYRIFGLAKDCVPTFRNTLDCAIPTTGGA